MCVAEVVHFSAGIDSVHLDHLDACNTLYIPHHAINTTMAYMADHAIRLAKTQCVHLECLSLYVPQKREMT